jgi:predicted TIM-barrel fold metal-dependent hydrolase
VLPAIGPMYPQPQMATPRERGAIDVDIHPHIKGGLGSLLPYMPRQSRVRSASDAALHEKPLPGSDPATVAREHLDRLELAAAVLLPLDSLNGFSDPLTAAIYASAINGFFIENWLPTDARYHLGIMIAPHDSARAAVEIRRRQATPRVAGILLPLLNILMGDRHYYPIYRAAVQHGLPVIVHPTGPEAAYYGAPVVAGGVPATFIERHVALPQIAQANISSLILNGVFERFPDLRVVFAGYGFAWLIALQWRMDMDWRRLRRETPWVRRAPSDYIHDHVRLTLQPMEEAGPAQFAKLLEMLAADRTLLFSSDYPHWDRVDMAELAARFPERCRAAVLRESALGTFGDRIRPVVPAHV